MILLISQHSTQRHLECHPEWWLESLGPSFFPEEGGWQNHDGQKFHPTLECRWWDGSHLASHAAVAAAGIPPVLAQLEWPLVVSRLPARHGTASWKRGAALNALPSASQDEDMGFSQHVVCHRQRIVHCVAGTQPS